ncbi:MAG: hypothetical protein QM709_03970 [Spongiibacteraceae bacterium]
MKRPINACAQLMKALLIMVGAQCFVLGAHAAPANADAEQIAQVLDLLGVRALIEQTPAILTPAIEAETQFLGSKPQPANWRRDIEAQLKAPIILQNVTRFLHERALARKDSPAKANSRSDIFLRVQQRLQEPIAKRARYFDLAMTQPGAEKNLRNFLAQNGLGQSDAAAKKSEAAASGDDARRAVLREIDSASSSTLLMATLQSAIAARVRQAASGRAVDAALLQDEIAERQRYLEPLAIDYLAYDYRYLRDDELHEYRDLLRDDNVQWVLDICYQALLAAIVGELTPLPVKPQ